MKQLNFIALTLTIVSIAPSATAYLIQQRYKLVGIQTYLSKDVSESVSFDPLEAIRQDRSQEKKSTIKDIKTASIETTNELFIAENGVTDNISYQEYLSEKILQEEVELLKILPYQCIFIFREYLKSLATRVFFNAIALNALLLTSSIALDRFYLHWNLNTTILSLSLPFVAFIPYYIIYLWETSSSFAKSTANSAESGNGFWASFVHSNIAPRLTAVLEFLQRQSVDPSKQAQLNERINMLFKVQQQKSDDSIYQFSKNYQKPFDSFANQLQRKNNNPSMALYSRALLDDIYFSSDSYSDIRETFRQIALNNLFREVELPLLLREVQVKYDLIRTSPTIREEYNLVIEEYNSFERKVEMKTNTTTGNNAEEMSKEVLERLVTKKQAKFASVDDAVKFLIEETSVEIESLSNEDEINSTDRDLQKKKVLLSQLKNFQDQLRSVKKEKNK